MRLNVYLQKAGIGSRRQAERLVAEGRVKVNGNLALATTPAEESDVVTLDGRPVAPATKPLPRLFVLNKPLDVLVTHRPQGAPDDFRFARAQSAEMAQNHAAGDECGAA